MIKNKGNVFFPIGLKLKIEGYPRVKMLLSFHFILYKTGVFVKPNNFLDFLYI